MLQNLKREATEEEHKERNQEEIVASREKTDFQDRFEDSFDNSCWSTYKIPAMEPQAYASEMKKNNPSLHGTLNDLLNESNPRDWAGLMSPPAVLPSVRAQQKKESLSDVESIGNELDSMGLSDGSSSIKSSNTGIETDEEEMLDLMYDPCLNCYFDPRTGKYYELKN